MRQRIEGSGGVVVSGEHGTLECFEGTTDWQCLTGVRALRPRLELTTSLVLPACSMAFQVQLRLPCLP
jgi:hypothetical protein